MPPAITSSLAAYGRHELDPQGGHLTGYSGQFEYDAWQASQADPSGFVREVAAAGVSAGGEAAYGAHRLIASMIGHEVRDPGYLRALDAGIDFLRATGRWPAFASPVEMRREAERHER